MSDNTLNQKIAALEKENANLRNSKSIRDAANARLVKMDQFQIKETECIPSVVVRYYYAKHQELAGSAFLQDAARYISLRNPALNEDKTWFQLLADFARKVDFDKTTSF